MKVTVRPYKVLTDSSGKTLEVNGVVFQGPDGIVPMLRAVLGAAQILWPESMDLKGVFIGVTPQRKKGEPK